VPVLLYKLYGARTILNTIIQSLTPHNYMLNMSLVKHSVTVHYNGCSVSYANLNEFQYNSFPKHEASVPGAVSKLGD